MVVHCKSHTSLFNSVTGFPTYSMFRFDKNVKPLKMYFQSLEYANKSHGYYQSNITQQVCSRSLFGFFPDSCKFGVKVV